MLKAKNQQGITLIEVLITLVILAVAMTGIAAVQITTMQSATQVKFRSAAMASAQSMLETMRASRFGETAAESLANLKSYEGSYDSAPASSTPAGRDYLTFKDEIDASLRNRSPDFEITVDAIRNVTVDISWSERNEDESSNADTVVRTYTVTARL